VAGVCAERRAGRSTAEISEQCALSYEAQRKTIFGDEHHNKYLLETTGWLARSDGLKEWIFIGPECP